VTVADVPAAGPSPLGDGVEIITDRLTTGLLTTDLSGVVCHDGGEVGLSGFVHVASMGQIRTEVNGPGPVPRLSHPVEEVCHRLIILCFGLKAATVNLTRELATLGGRRGQIPTLSEDLLGVGVGSGFVHDGIIAQNRAKIKGWWTVLELV